MADAQNFVGYGEVLYIQVFLHWFLGFPIIIFVPVIDGPK
jgi:hypothetical protein